jgi:hypothetical protein
MTAAYLKQGHTDTVLDALRTLAEQQRSTHEMYNDGYEQVNSFGRIPIVCIPQEKEKDFLLQRLGASWMTQLWNYCKTKCPDVLASFPTPSGVPSKEPPTLTDCQVQDLRNFYVQLLVFRKNLLDTTKDSAVPGPSFSLRRFMEGKLFDITPGTNDAEIHFIRSLFQVIRTCDESQAAEILHFFAKPLANALFYLHMNVLDPKDGLPIGCDCRDTFADLLYDSKTCTNALFWYEVLQTLASQAKILEKTALRQYIKDAIEGHRASFCKKEVPKRLEELAACSKPLETILTEAAHDLEPAIKKTFFMRDGVFSPIDFVPGKRAIAERPGELPAGLVSPIVSTPIIPLIIKHNPDFIHGKQIDPQSLARAVLLGLVPQEQYDQVVECFKKNDSPIGVEVFIPISGTNDREKELLDTVHGRVVWPHISWTVVRALIAMGTRASLEMAEQQAEKLMKLPGLGEWYAQDPSGSAVQCGDPSQGWTASSLILATEDLNKSARESPVYSMQS